MNKILLIIRREYITRVRRRVFLITTLLAPLIIASFTVLPIYLANISTEEQNVAVIDQSNLFKGKLESKDKMRFTDVSDSYDALKNSYTQKGYTGILVIPAEFTIDHPVNVEYYSTDQLGLMTQGSIEDKMNDVLRKLQFQKANISTEVMDEINHASVSVVQENEGHSDAGVATGLGYIMGFMIYITLLLYGTQVMRGVMEEKSNRIAEVIVSSVKPFQLMMGKIIGIALVGLTQFVIWIILTAVIQGFVTSFYGVDAAHAQQQIQSMNGMGQQGGFAQQLAGVVTDINKLPLTLIIGGFLFFFLGGYLLYASMFAAIGAAAGDESDQSLTFVATMPIIISIIILINVLNEPNGKLAVIGSFIPFTAPVIMCGRLPFVPPTWQILTSMISLVAGFLFMVWLAGKIYRTGILMYGKKTSLKEMLKWVRY